MKKRAAEGRLSRRAHSHGQSTYLAMPGALLVVLLLAGAAFLSATEIPDLTDGFTPPEIAPGSPAGSYALSGFDTINYYSGRIGFALPLRQIGGRGEAGYTMYLKIDQPWTVDRDTPCDGCTEIQNPIPTWWSSNQVGYGPGIVEARRTPNLIATGCSPSLQADSSISRISFIGPDGSEIEMRDVLTNGQPTVQGQSGCNVFIYTNRGKIFKSADGSNVTFVATQDLLDSNVPSSYNPTGELYFPSGLQYHIVNGLVLWIRDRNGNKITFEYNDPLATWRVTKIIDSLKRVTLFSYGVSCSASLGCDRIQFVGYNGYYYRTVEVRYQSLSSTLLSGAIDQYDDLFPELNSNNHTNHNPKVVSSVSLPNSQEYQFKYNNYGDLSWLKLPTGGRFEYTWVSGTGTGGGGYNQKIILRRVSERRTYLDTTTSTPQTKTTISRADTTGCQPLGSFTGSNVLVSHFDVGGTTEISRERHYYCGKPGESASSTPTQYGSWKSGREYKSETFLSTSTVARTAAMTFAQRPSVGENIWWGTLEADTAPPNDPRLTVSQTTLHDITPNLVSKQEYKYDQYNNRTDVAEFDFTGANPVRRTHLEYKTDTAYINTPVYLRRLTSKQWVCGSGSGDCTEGAAVAKTEYLYDGTTITARSGIIGQATGFGTGYTTRGNITKLRKWRNLPTSVWLETTLEYDVAGNLVKITDPKTNITTAAYDDSFTNSSILELLSGEKTFAFPTSITRPLSQTVTVKYDYYLGRTTRFTDPNGVASTYTFNDTLDRLTQAVTGIATNFAYSDAGPNPTVTKTAPGTGPGNGESKVIYDGLGREVTTQAMENDSVWPYECSKVTKSYDGLGRVKEVTNPYRQSCSTVTVTVSGNKTTTAYDWLSRVTSLTAPGSAVATKVHSGNKVTATDPATKKMEHTADALGRLVKVIEDPGTSPKLNYVTTYTYDPLDKLTQINQSGNGGTQQLRNFTYDSLARLLTADNPEDTGNLQYAYDDNGNLTTKTDARGVVTNILYDALNRVTEKNYNTAPGVTPTARYCYDGKIYNTSTSQCVTGSISYSIGRMTGEGVQGTSATNYTGLDQFGRVTASTQSTANAYQGTFTSYSFSYTYNIASWLTSETYPSGKVINYAYDAAGRPTKVSTPPALDFGKNIAYAPNSAMEQMQFGNGLYEQTCYNNRLQPTQKRLGAAVQTNCTNPGTDLLHLTFGYGTATANNGNPVSQTIAASGYTLTQNYGYDPVNRLKIAVEGAAVPGSMTCPVTTSWCQEYNFDHFGNRWVASNLPLHSATPTSAAAFSATTNRLSAATYDNAGNLTAHPFITPSGSIAYDANNLATQFTATSITASDGYDAQGRRIRQTHNGVTAIYVYDALGRLAVEYSSQAPAQTNGIYYRTIDHLGSTRIVTDSAGKVKLRRDFFPFGEEIPASASYGNRHLITDNGVATYNAWSGIPQQFTGQQRDLTGLDYFWARNYAAPPGRFLSVDPSGAGAIPGKPNSWNAYAYVMGNPMRFWDSDGRACDPWAYCVEVTADPWLIGTDPESIYATQGPILQPGVLTDRKIDKPDEHREPKPDIEIDPLGKKVLGGVGDRLKNMVCSTGANLHWGTNTRINILQIEEGKGFVFHTGFRQAIGPVVVSGTGGVGSGGLQAAGTMGVGVPAGVGVAGVEWGFLSSEGYIPLGFFADVSQPYPLFGTSFSAGLSVFATIPITAPCPAQ